VGEQLLRQAVGKMVTRIGIECSTSGRTLVSRLPPPDERQAWYQRKVLDADNRQQVFLDDEDRPSIQEQRLDRESSLEVMEEALAWSGIDPHDALWVHVNEPTLGDLACGEESRGFIGIGDDVPESTFLFRWVLCCLASALLPTGGQHFLRNVTIFPFARVREVLSSRWKTFEGGDLMVLTCSSGTSYFIDRLLRVTRVMLPIPFNHQRRFHHLSVFRARVDRNQYSVGQGFELSFYDLLSLEGKAADDSPPDHRWEILEEITRAVVDDPGLQFLKTVYRRQGFHSIVFEA